MPKRAQFRVDPRLASLLGESYRSTEQALKELIDNAWDADAEHVWITLPEPMTLAPIVVRDDGSGMTEREVRGEYLKVARNRRTTKGDRTLKKQRAVKGRKGIGKFAGLVAADVMDLDTRVRGQVTTLRIVKQQVLEAQQDLEKIDLPIETQVCSKTDHGTTLTLSSLNTHFTLPQPDALRELLALEYGRERDFSLFVNGEQLAHEDIPGDKFTATIDLPSAGIVTVNFTIMEHPASKTQAGIVMRVGGKVVGRPSLMGLDDDRELPARLLRHVVGEVVADSLEEDVTADWGAIIENSIGYQEAKKWVRNQISHQVRDKFQSDVKVEAKRRESKIEQRLARLPEHRREIARKQIQQILQKCYGESEERIDTVVDLMLSAIEKDEYWLVCEHIHAARNGDVETLAAALEEFGLVDLAVMSQQACRRLEFLDNLDALDANPKTLEREMHRALDRNLWVFGPQYSMIASNQTLSRAIEEYSAKAFKGKRKNKRPDLFLGQDAHDRCLLIEFKRPDESVGRDAEAQAKKYRDDLTPTFGPISILIIGGNVDVTMSAHYKEAELQFLSYKAIISRSRISLQWLLNELVTT
jgi:hypothetical protein